jgi:hypothetical protein
MKRPRPGCYTQRWGWKVSVELEAAEVRADLLALRALLPEGRVGRYAQARYMVKGKFYGKWFPCKVVAETKHGCTVEWNDGDQKDTFKQHKDIDWA